MQREAVLPRPQTGRAPEPRVPDVSRWVLANGLRVVAIERHDLPQVAARLVIPAGSAADPEGLEGLSAMTSSLLLEGNESSTAVEFHRRLDLLGATIDTRAGQDFVEIDLGLLSETVAEGLELLRDVVLSPTFPEREVERIRAETLDSLEARLDEPANVADDSLSLGLFGPEHPYGRLSSGTVEAVVRIDRASIEAFHARWFRPDGSVLVVAGDFEIATLKTLLDNALGGWTGRVPPIEYPPLAERPVDAGQLRNEEIADAPQAEIRFGGRGIARGHQDWIPAAVANFILGGSTITGRLGSNLREDKGWTYGVRSGFSAGVQAGGWLVETAVGADVAEDALREIRHEIGRIISEKVTAEEVGRAREALILSLPRAFETPGRTVARFATIEAYGLAADYWETFPDRVRQVDERTVTEMAEKYFAPEALVRVVVGPAIVDES